MMRAVPGISDEFKPLDDAIDTFIRTIIRGYRFSFDERELFPLPAKLGGLGIIIPSKICDAQYSNSRTITEKLTSHVTQQNVNGSVDTEKFRQNIAMIKSENTARNKASLDSVRLKLPANKQKVLEAVTEVGASAWLTTVPVNAHGLYLDKKSFWDALRLRYDILLERLPSNCVYGNSFNIEHSLSCHKGGFISIVIHMISPLIYYRKFARTFK